jgi:hypothetical protein
VLVVTFDHQTEAAAADAKKEDAPKSPSLLSKLLAPFKNVEKRAKSPKSPKKEKKEESKVRMRLHHVMSFPD